MSLDYGYIFSQIDKAKKKRWTQADTDKWTKQLKEEKELPKSRERIGESFTRIPGRKRGKQVADKKPSESSTRIPGRKRGKGTVTSTGEKTTRNDQTVPSTAEVRIQDLDETGKVQAKRGLDRKGLPRNFQREKDRREEAKEKKEKQEEDLKEGIPASHSTLDPKSHIKYRMVTDAKGNRVKVQVTERSRDHQDNKKPISRKQQLRRESGTFNIKDPIEANRRLAAADRKFEKERDTISTTSYQEFLRNRKKNPPPSGGFVQDTDDPKDINYDPVSHMEDYYKTVKEREAARAKRDADKKERESIDPKTKLPKGPKRIEPPRKDRKKKPKVEEYQSEGDPNPEVEGGIDGDDDQGEITAREYKETGKALWKSWLKNKVDMKRHKRPEEYEEKETIEEKWNKEEQKKRQSDPKVQVETREGESYKKYKERQDAVEDPREHKTLTQQLDDMGVLNQDVEPAPEPATSAPAPKPATSAPKPKPATSGGFIQDINDPEDIANKALWKSWLEKKDCPNCGKKIKKKKRKLLWNFITQPPDIYPSEIEGREDDEEEDEEAKKSLWKAWLEKKIDPKDCPYCKGNWSKNRKERWEMEDTGGEAGRLASLIQQWHDNDPDHFHATVSHAPPEMQEASDRDEERKLKAEEGIGGMNMGSQRGLGHDAGYKQDPGESAQITEVKEKTDKCPECKSKLVVPGDYKSSKEKRGHKIRYCDDCGHEWEKKSAYENHEQDESPDSQPNKQQIPASKPGMDALKMYKKALIIKYNNIYKPANI